MAILEFVIILFVMTIYFLPALAAAWRRHPKTLSILALNFFLGITLIGWILAMTWAFSQNAVSHRKYDNNSSAYGGMAVSTAERINAAVLVGVAAIVALALTAAVSVHQIREIHDAFAGQIDHGGLRPAEGQSGSAIQYAALEATPSEQLPAKRSPLPSTSLSKPPHITTAPKPTIKEHAAVVTASIGKKARVRSGKGRRFDANKLYVDGVPPAERPPSHPQP